MEITGPRDRATSTRIFPVPLATTDTILRRCDRFGRWMPPVFECSVHYCPAITIAGHEVKESLEGTHYTWPCSLPLSGYVRVHCLPGGNWSVVEDHCMPVNCDVFLSSDISIDTTHFVYNGGDNVTRMTVELFPQSNEELWNGEREARISHYNPLRLYDVILKTYSMNDIEFVSNLCIVRSMQLTNICQTMAAPFLEKIKQDKKGGMIVFIGFVYPPCRTENLPDFNIHVTSMEECPSHTEFSLRFSCMTLVNECRANTVGHYTIRSGLRIDCSYSVSVELLTKGRDRSLPPLVASALHQVIHSLHPLEAGSLCDSRLHQVHPALLVHPDLGPFLLPADGSCSQATQVVSRRAALFALEEFGTIRGL